MLFPDDGPMGWPASVSAEMEVLLALPLFRFTREKRRMAARLRRERRGHDASFIETLKKPQPAVWACNELARRDSEAVESLLEIAAEWMRAYDKRDQSSEAFDREVALRDTIRRKLIELTSIGKAILHEARLSVYWKTLHTVYMTLQSYATTSERSRVALRRGLITWHWLEDDSGRIAPTKQFPFKEVVGAHTEPPPRSAEKNKIRKSAESPNRN